MTASIAKMSGFLEVAITYTFHSPLCVRCLRLSGSSAYRGAVRVAILVSYMYRGDGRRNFDTAGEERREKFLSRYFSLFLLNCPPPPKLIWNSSKMAARNTIHNSGPGVNSLAITMITLCRKCTGKWKFPGKTIQTGSSSRSVRNSCDRRNI